MVGGKQPKREESCGAILKVTSSVYFDCEWVLSRSREVLVDW